MKKRGYLWLVPAVLWLLFTAWYTDFGGPLSGSEVNEAMATLRARGMDTGRLDTFERFLREDDGRQFLMVNVIDLADDPPHMEGFGADATAEDYQDHYMAHMYPALFARASHPIFYGVAVGPALDVTGIDGAGSWDYAALVRYRSRRSFMEVITLPDTVARHAYKLAAMTRTLAYPVTPVLYLSDPRLLLALVLGLATALGDRLLYGCSRGRG